VGAPEQAERIVLCGNATAVPRDFIIFETLDASVEEKEISGAVVGNQAVSFLVKSAVSLCVCAHNKPGTQGRQGECCLNS